VRDKKRIFNKLIFIRGNHTLKVHPKEAYNKPDSLKEKLIETINKAVIGVSPFSVKPAFIGGFPHLHHSNVIWVGVNGDTDKLMIIQERIQTDLAYLHLPTDNRPFTPHITIVKHQGLVVDRFLQDKLQNIMKQHFDPILIDSIKLFESIPDKGFHTHNTLAEIKLS
ncbi:MAG: 2'-5' RNA ligase family protein, partial [Patescibacteria group bacterium]|nr:2'-5' RNA ligase family protein [Patescibacteria group bacterium]